MDEFPFTQEEWDHVAEVVGRMVNASLAGEIAVHDSLMNDLDSILDELRRRHGEHPILIETAADFLDDPTERIRLYRAAVDLAERNRLPTITIRLSLVEVLLEHLGDSRAAADELLACRDESRTTSDPDDRRKWSELMRDCVRKSASKEKDA